ncbi:MAG: cyclic nucleotide-binding domain-containing protein [Anaerolineae bacterium]|uniref:cyclic nucleotide-binding domain-containing protein n=1 Tax=Promineifilum sp. TaxID=2664178 RepID=UPI001DBB7B4C|nr:cyclic nucleotide-binding domain-containing protein [Anaerolineales bacterium]MCB8936765.1 cyclic nucleotide-binding domain-containing protein [Promineifilum sp.]MCO5178766.1 cyclic nucleotide-binding domain-containing protein [Promineifilum sp.]MCW5846888.1 cyclic nucleotide-binding domain-containing protein [Anaerolineae bacterium]
MQPSIRTILATTEIFDNFNESQLTLVAALCTPVTYGEGHVLLSENDESDEMYIIGRGGVEVLVNPGTVGAAGDQERMEPVVLTELRQGQVVGEVALVDQGVRSATIRVSRDDSLLLRLRRDQLMRLCETYPVLGYKLMRNLASELATKIRNTDWLVRQYQLRLQSDELDAH